FTSASNEDHYHAALVNRFRELRARNWEIKLIRIYRETNVLADFLTHLGHSYNFNIHILTISSADLTNWILYNQLSMSQYHLTESI
ncbi:hypothetical protein LINGRAHAP2_LOCUS6089, partial [Linum grandiflorum]